MDRSAEGERPVSVKRTAGEVWQQEGRSINRRLVQSTLFPHKPSEVESNGYQKGDKECNVDDEDGQDEEHCGCQGKKKRARKGKTTPQTKAPKKANEKASANSTPKNKTTPKKTTTLKKNATSNGKTTAHVVENGDTSPPIPNLRLEAKMTAEENSRIFAGKQIHPFFSSLQVGKRYHDASEADNNHSLGRRKGKSITIGPIHVFEIDQDPVVPPDWSNWVVCEKAFTSSCCSLECPFSSIFEGTVDSLHANIFPCMPRTFGTSRFQDNMSMDQRLLVQEPLHEASATVSTTSDVYATCCQLVNDADTDCEVAEFSCSSGCLRKSDADQQSEFFEERILSYNPGSANQLEDRLWIDKYQPKKATEVCGNDESVKFMSEWLRSWHQRGHQSSKDSSVGDKFDMEDTAYNFFQSDSDSDYTNEGTILKNVLLVTGPVGSGKSAAIYACAREQGFKVLEANASECRNGSVVRQRFGQALESHSLEWSHENPVESESNHFMKLSTEIPSGKMMREFNREVIELIPILDEDNSCGATGTAGKYFCNRSIAFGRGQLKPLILFEDVDITFPEDRGFIAAIQQIADKAKGPVILTCNSHSPVVPDNLDRLEVCFAMPSDDELLQYMHVVCSAEKANIQPHLMKQLIKCCRGDIRKTIMHLQYWFQGEHSRKGREAKRMPSLQCDPESAHQLLPKMIPWDFPSQLSELIENEIKMSLSKMEENSAYKELIEKEFGETEMHRNFGMHVYETDSVEAKKEAMLSRNMSGQDCSDLGIPVDDECDFFNSLGNAVSFPWQNSRRKLNIVMSSDSEDESLNDRCPVTSNKDTDNKVILDGNLPSHCPSLQNCFGLSTDMRLSCVAEKLEESGHQCSETAIDLHLRDTRNSVDFSCVPECESVDVSCVPESSFVPETEINNRTEVCVSLVSCGQVADLLEEVSARNEFKHDPSPVKADNLRKSIPKIHDIDVLGSTCDANAASREEVEDSQNECVEVFTKQYQVMDECSCMDFERNSKQVEKLRSHVVTDLVQDSWRKLRDCCTDLRVLVASEHKDASGVIKLAYGMSNLISEAEILFSKCQSLGSLESSTVLSEASEAFNCYDEQLQMTSMIVHHGFFSYAKDIDAVGLKMGSGGRFFNWDILPVSCKSDVGSSVGEGISSGKTSLAELVKEMNLPESGTLVNRLSASREMRSHLSDIIQSIVPSRTYMTMKGDAFYEYLSCLGHISRSEASRISEGIDQTKWRRGRAARNYLSTGVLKLSTEEISLLGQSNVYGKISSQLEDANVQ